MSETSSVPVAPPRIKRAQQIALTLLMISGVVNYLDRGTLAAHTAVVLERE